MLIYYGDGGLKFLGPKSLPEDQELKLGNLALKNSMDEKTVIRVIKKLEFYKDEVFVYDGLYDANHYRQTRNEDGRIVFGFHLNILTRQPAIDHVLNASCYTQTYGKVQVAEINSPHWRKINDGINSDCANRFRGLKSKFGKHFKKVGGKEDLENSRKKPHSLIDKKKWNKLIDDLFLTPEYIERSEQNSINRAKQSYPSCGGSRPYAQTRHLDLKSTGKTSEIDNWRSMHLNVKGGWVNNRAAQDWDKIQEEVSRMQRDAGDDKPIDEVECLQRALGSRSDWERGIERKLKNSSANNASVYEPTPSQWDTMQQQMSQLITRVNELEKKKGE
ncbi:uncharacterized protein LOC143632062 [Bidens hawaiensis]|uniref:uncharacterized protein LOC143632062 n=1 Tax=Bidens hawaiensis TaxID=980011 RepID=UPI00404A285E